MKKAGITVSRSNAKALVYLQKKKKVPLKIWSRNKADLLTEGSHGVALSVGFLTGKGS